MKDSSSASSCSSRAQRTMPLCPSDSCSCSRTLIRQQEAREDRELRETVRKEGREDAKEARRGTPQCTATLSPDVPCFIPTLSFTWGSFAHFARVSSHACTVKR